MERDKADRAFEEELTAVDETADAVVSRARARTDRCRGLPPAPPYTMTGRERAREDHALREERAAADQVLHEERSERLVVFSREREETDKDLLTERAQSDDALATRDEFLGIISHDLRNMLNTMVGSAALIADRVSREDPAEEVRGHAQMLEPGDGEGQRVVPAARFGAVRFDLATVQFHEVSHAGQPEPEATLRTIRPSPSPPTRGRKTGSWR